MLFGEYGEINNVYLYNDKLLKYFLLTFTHEP